MKIFKSLAVAAALVFAANSASAAMCSVAVLNGVTPNVGCHQGVTGTGGSGNDSEAILNGESTFGETMWTQIAKDDDLNGTETGNAAALTVTGSLISGTISIADFVFDMYKTVAIVLKSGGGQGVVPGYWIAYEVEKIPGTYSYNSPFIKNGKPIELSHVSLYGAGSMTVVPLPAAGGLLLAGLGGLVLVRRRKRG